MWPEAAEGGRRAAPSRGSTEGGRRPDPKGSPLGVSGGAGTLSPFPRATLSVSLLVPPTDLYCTLEVDSFGYFVSKAKTRVFRDTTEPKWDEVSGGGWCPHRDPRACHQPSHPTPWAHHVLLTGVAGSALPLTPAPLTPDLVFMPRLGVAAQAQTPLHQCFRGL